MGRQWILRTKQPARRFAIKQTRKNAYWRNNPFIDWINRLPFGWSTYRLNDSFIDWIINYLLTENIHTLSFPSVVINPQRPPKCLRLHRPDSAHLQNFQVAVHLVRLLQRLVELVLQQLPVHGRLPQLRRVSPTNRKLCPSWIGVSGSNRLTVLLQTFCRHWIHIYIGFKDAQSLPHVVHSTTGRYRLPIWMYLCIMDIKYISTLWIL